MILPFSTQMNGKPTYFVERIHKGIRENYMLAPIDPTIHYPNNYNFIAKDKLLAKLHTIREDKNDRWKAGTKIDFFINCRQKDMFRFAPVLPVVSVQKVEILWTVESNNVFTAKTKTFNRKFFSEVAVYVEGKCLTNYELKLLTSNDGFDTIEDFFTYFKEDFKGKIIHWTDLRY